jgi:hypothetical protein
MTEQQKAITITITITNLRSRRGAQKARKNPQHKQKPHTQHQNTRTCSRPQKHLKIIAVNTSEAAHTRCIALTLPNHKIITPQQKTPKARLTLN